VIGFTNVAHDGRSETTKNTNAPEAEAIWKELRQLADLEVPPSVGIITPHTEQQAMLVQLVDRQDDAERLKEVLDLKIMTFDTCQGEERDVILYSMVAIPLSDKLAYVFPKPLEEAEEVDHVLRPAASESRLFARQGADTFFRIQADRGIFGPDSQGVTAFQRRSGKSQDGARTRRHRPEIADGKEGAGVAQPDAADAAVWQLHEIDAPISYRRVSAPIRSDLSASELKSTF
jgi:hypothetical protein